MYWGCQTDRIACWHRGVTFAARRKTEEFFSLEPPSVARFASRKMLNASANATTRALISSGPNDGGQRARKSPTVPWRNRPCPRWRRRRRRSSKHFLCRLSAPHRRRRPQNTAASPHRSNAFAHACAPLRKALQQIGKNSWLAQLESAKCRSRRITRSPRTGAFEHSRSSYPSMPSVLAT